jgi:hypothetical protein
MPSTVRTTSPARPDLTVHNEIVRMKPRALVAELTAILGKKMTALIAGVKDTRTVDAWIAGREDGRKFDTDRLRLALRIAKMLRARDDARVVQAWFMCLNPQLGDRSPARLVRDGDVLTDGEAVMSAARAFLVGG